MRPLARADDLGCLSVRALTEPGVCGLGLSVVPISVPPYPAPSPALGVHSYCYHARSLSGMQFWVLDK